MSCFCSSSKSCFVARFCPLVLKYEVPNAATAPTSAATTTLDNQPITVTGWQPGNDLRRNLLNCCLVHASRSLKAIGLHDSLLASGLHGDEHCHGWELIAVGGPSNPERAQSHYRCSEDCIQLSISRLHSINIGDVLGNLSAHNDIKGGVWLIKFRCVTNFIGKAGGSLSPNEGKCGIALELLENFASDGSLSITPGIGALWRERRAG